VKGFTHETGGKILELLAKRFEDVVEWLFLTHRLRRGLVHFNYGFTRETIANCLKSIGINVLLTVGAKD